MGEEGGREGGGGGGGNNDLEGENQKCIIAETRWGGGEREFGIAVKQV